MIAAHRSKSIENGVAAIRFPGLPDGLVGTERDVCRFLGRRGGKSQNVAPLLDRLGVVLDSDELVVVAVEELHARPEPCVTRAQRIHDRGSDSGRVH